MAGFEAIHGSGEPVGKPCADSSPVQGRGRRPARPSCACGQSCTPFRDLPTKPSRGLHRSCDVCVRGILFRRPPATPTRQKNAAPSAELLRVRSSDSPRLARQGIVSDGREEGAAEEAQGAARTRRTPRRTAARAETGTERHCDLTKAGSMRGRRRTWRAGQTWELRRRPMLLPSAAAWERPRRRRSGLAALLARGRPPRCGGDPALIAAAWEGRRRRRSGLAALLARGRPPRCGGDPAISSGTSESAGGCRGRRAVP